MEKQDHEVRKVYKDPQVQLGHLALLGQQVLLDHEVHQDPQ